MTGGWRRLGSLVLVGGLLAACGGASSPATSGGASPGAGGGATGAPGATGRPVSGGGDLCALLGPGDFAAAGIGGAAAPSVNSTEPGAAYCVYAGTSAATGGIELDVFVASAAADSPATFRTAMEGMSDADQAATRALLGTVDAAAFDPAVEGNFAAILVEQGKLVFTIGVPASASAKDQLVGLAKLVLQRASALS